MELNKIPQETKETVIRNYNNYKTMQYTLNATSVNPQEYYAIINDARAKGLITIPKHSPKPKPPKPVKVKKHPRDVKKLDDPEIYAEIIKLYNQGYTYEDISAKIGYPKTRVRYYLSISFYKGDAVAKYRKRPRQAIQWSQAELDNIRLLWYNGENYNRIANTMGVCPQTIVRLVEKLKLTRGDPKEILRQRILFLYRSGFSYKEISEKVNRCIAFVTKVIGDEKNRRFNLSPLDIDTIIQLYRQGLTVAQISRATNIGYQNVRNCLAKNGLIMIKR